MRHLNARALWRDYSRGARTWFWTAGIVAGFGVLAKGPVGVILPASIVLLFLLWEKKLGLLPDPRLLGGVLLLGLVAIPWYALVGVETKADFLIGFLLKHNLGRFVEPMEKHGGSPFYYVFVVLVGFGPWAVFLLSTFWFGTGDRPVNRAQRWRPIAFSGAGSASICCSFRSRALSCPITSCRFTLL